MYIHDMNKTVLVAATVVVATVVVVAAIGSTLAVSSGAEYLAEAESALDREDLEAAEAACDEVRRIVNRPYVFSTKLRGELESVCIHRLGLKKEVAHMPYSDFVIDDSVRGRMLQEAAEADANPK